MTNLISGHVRDFDVFLSNDVVTVINEDVVVTKQRAPGLSEFAAKAKAFRIGWAMLPGGDDVIYLYDKDDDNFGYAVNVQDPHCSEWGCAPFPS